MSFAFLILCFIVGLVAVAIVFGARRGSAVVGAIIGGVVLVVLLSVLSLMFYARVQQRVVIGSAMTPSPPSQSPFMISNGHVVQSDDWIDAFAGDETAPREPHTSTVTLANFMAARIKDAIDRVGESAQHRYIDFQPTVPPALRDKIFQAAETYVSKPAETGENDLVISVRMEDRAEAQTTWWPSPMIRGTVVAEVRGPKGTEEIRAKLDEKPWVDIPPASVGRRDFVVVKLGAPAASREEALDILWQRTESALAAAVYTQAQAQPGVRATLDDARRQVDASLAVQGRRYADQCVVALDRPYGRVWFAASLSHVESLDVAKLASSAQHVAVERHQSWRTMILSLGGMLLVLGLLYAVLNALTRGYVRAHLGVAVAVLLVIGAVVIVLGLGLV